MAKSTVDYKECLIETVEAFEEDRVLLVSQGKAGIPNAMAIGWGTVGIVWTRPVFVVLVRPSRFTYGLLHEAGAFSVNIVPPELKEVVTYCGTVSGRDHNKFKEKGLTALQAQKIPVPILKEGILHYECRIVQMTDVLPSTMDGGIISKYYPKGDHHRVFFGEILACQKEIG